MGFRTIAISAATAAVTLGSAAVPVANAAGGPPPPTSTNGNKVQLVGSGLKTPTSIAVGGGSVFVGDGGNSEGSAPPNGGLYVLKSGNAVLLKTPLKFVAGVAWHKNSLYTSGGVLTKAGPSWRLYKWSGWNGTAFKSHKLLYKAAKKFDGFNGLGFGANGRLYVGVDVGLTDGNDHGPASTSPHVYQILSFTANGKHHSIFAKGIRQPWQMAFKPGSNSPYVTDLGQDGGATNPPDFILHVKAGDNYGFPKCNQTVAKACKGKAKPFRKFGPHTDLMGIGLRQKTLYLTSFLGLGAKGPGGEVFSMSLHGHTLKPLITGFVAPTVGLTVHGKYVYVGELTGQVFRLKL